MEVLITYSETSSIVPLYNESVSSSTSTDSGRNDNRNKDRE